MKNSNIRIGLFGVGHFGKLHLKNLLQSPFEFVGFYDPDQAVVQDVLKNYDVRFFESEEALLEAVDAVDIVVPTRKHIALAELAARYHKHMFIEKPIAAGAEEARTFVEKMKHSGLKVQVGHIERFNPAFKAVKPLIKAPHYVEAHRLAPFNPRGNDVSVIHDLMIHDLDAILSLIDKDLKEVHASGKSLLTHEIDFCEARLVFEDGVIANLCSSRIHHEQVRKTKVFCEEQIFEIDYLNKVSKKIQRTSNVNNGVEKPVFQWQTPQGSFYVTEEEEKFKTSNAILEELNEFYNSIVHDEPTKVDQENALQALLIADKIYEITRAKMNHPA
jgi:predicted dehydrogenase